MNNIWNRIKIEFKAFMITLWLVISGIVMFVFAMIVLGSVYASYKINAFFQFIKGKFTN